MLIDHIILLFVFLVTELLDKIYPFYDTLFTHDKILSSEVMTEMEYVHTNWVYDFHSIPTMINTHS